MTMCIGGGQGIALIIENADFADVMKEAAE
jgi:hypothetical protein